MILSTTLPELAGQFLWVLGLGFLTLFPLLSVKKIGRSYHQWNYFIVSFCFFFASQLLTLSPFWKLFSGGAFLLSLSFIPTLRLKWLRRCLIVPFYGLVYLGFVFEIWGSSWLLKVDVGSSALLLGAVGAALVIGHWYLVAQGLSFGFLTNYTRLIAVGLFIRAFCVYFILRALPDLKLLHEISMMDLFWWTRLIVGLGLPFLFVCLTLGTLRYKNNQAATGILYVVLIFVFMGEIMHEMMTLRAGGL